LTVKDKRNKNMRNINYRLILYVFAGFVVCFQTIAQKTQNNKSFLPVPTGKFKIGTTEFFLKDTLPHKKDKNKYQRLYVKIWYPSDSVVNPVLYNQYLKGYDLDEIYNNFKKKGVTKEEIVEISRQRTYSASGLSISSTEKEYPIIIFTPGYYFGLSEIYSSFLENLASNGYIVCCIVHVNEQVCVKGTKGENTKLKKAKASLPFLQWWWAGKICFRNADKPQNQEKLTRYFLNHLSLFDKKIHLWEANILYVIDYLKEQKQKHDHSLYSHINFDKIGTLGQSFGGALSNDLCINNDQIKAGASLDCFQFGDVIDSESSKPLLLIESDHQKTWRIGNEFIYKDVTKLEYLRIKGSLHFLFCDLPYYNVAVSQKKVNEFIGNIDGKRAIAMINSTLLTFFNEHLKNNKGVIGNNFIDNDLFLHQKNNKCIFLK